MRRDRQAGLCECARPVRGRRPAASGFWETHSARVLIKNTQATLSTDAWGFWTFLTHSHSYTHVYTCAQHGFKLTLFPVLHLLIDTYFNFNFSIFCFLAWCLWQPHLANFFCGSSKNSLCQFWSQSFKHSSGTRQQFKAVSFANVLADNFWNKILFSSLDALEVPWIWLFQFPPDFLENSQMEYSNFAKLCHASF